MIILFAESIIYHWSGDIDFARSLMDRNIELYPGFFGMYRRKAEFHFTEGEYDEAAQMWLKEAELQNLSTGELEAMRGAVELSGFKGLIKGKNEIEMKNIPITLNKIAYNYYVMGDYDKALDWFERLVDERNFRMTHINVSPDYSDPAFRSNPRFQAILKKMNFPEVESPS